MLLYYMYFNKKERYFMDQKYLEKLEFNKIKEILSSYTITYLGKSYALDLFPMNNKKDIEKALDQTFDASTLILRKGNIPLSPIDNLDLHIKKIESSNFLNTKQLLDLAKILKMARDLKEYFSSEEIDMSEFISLENLFNNLYTNLSLETTIFKNILDENTISDDASTELKNIRKTIKQKENDEEAITIEKQKEQNLLSAEKNVLKWEEIDAQNELHTAELKTKAKC